MKVSGKLKAPAALPTGNNPSTCCVWSWVGPRTDLDFWRKGKSVVAATIPTPDRAVRNLVATVYSALLLLLLLHHPAVAFLVTVDKILRRLIHLSGLNKTGVNKNDIS
jgi:hypothetical protein